jgi:GNAT superfamily N-acetyltransferase
MTSESVKACRFPSSRQKTRALTEFLRQYADELPAAVIKKAAASDEHRKWETVCDSRGEIAAAMRYEHNDWYLCTLKNAAVRPDMRGQGIGGAMYVRTAQRAAQNPMCKVLAGDVTHDNLPSIRAIRRAGFRSVGRFCWGKGQKPADIFHLILLPPSNGDRC